MWQRPVAVSALVIAGILLGGPSPAAAQVATIDAAPSTAGASIPPELDQTIDRAVREYLDQLSDEQREAIVDAAAAIAAGRTSPPVMQGATSREGTFEGETGTLGLIVLLVAMLAVGSVVVGIPMSSGPADRRIVYRLGRTDRDLIVGATTGGSRLAIVRPIVDRSVRVRGDLVTSWDAVRDALPQGWAVARPRRDSRRREWHVMAEGPFHRAGVRRRRVEAAGSTEAAVLSQLASDLAALPASVAALPSTGADARDRRWWRRYLRNPYRLPVHGRHFFLLPESWYDEQEDQRGPDLESLLTWGVHGRNLVLAGLDFGLTFVSPVVLVLALLQACGV